MEVMKVLHITLYSTGKLCSSDVQMAVDVYTNKHFCSK